MKGLQENYSLYHTLVAQNDGEMDVATQKQCIEKINKLDVTKRAVVFLLICEHSRFTEDTSLDAMYWEEKLPYGCEKLGHSVKFDFSKFPIDLQWVIYRFLKI